MQRSGSGSTIDKTDEIFNDFSLLVPILIIGYLKNKYLYINEIFLVRKKGRCFKKMLMVKSLRFFMGAGAGADAKNTRSRTRSKMDRLRNNGLINIKLQLPVSSFQFPCIFSVVIFQKLMRIRIHRPG